MVGRGWGGLQVAAKLFTSHSKLFKARQICFSGGTQRVGEEGEREWIWGRRAGGRAGGGGD